MVPYAKTFDFVGYKADLASGQITFSYEVGSKDGRVEQFKESLFIPGTPSNISENTQATIETVLQSLHLILGISYYKLYCPHEIKINGFSLSKEQAKFWDTVYTKGLGEFFYKNKIDYRNLIKFPAVESTSLRPISHSVSDKYLLGIGGGKDSIVAAEMLKADKKDFTSFILGNNPISKKIVDIIGGDRIIVERKIDPKLIELNKSADVYNGHIPISAIYAFVGLLIATVGGFKYLTFANEKSANFGNVDYLGGEINHQWSKSSEFENLFREYVQTFITDSVQYSSILRGLYDIEIARQFSKYEQYFSIFSSCNSNFKINRESPKKRWCGICPKCAFVFCILAAFVDKEKMINVFGKNLLDDSTLLDVYRQLLGVLDFKPFECVGTPEEAKAAFYLLSQNKDYEDDLAVKMFKAEVLSDITDIEKLKSKVLHDN